MTYGALGRGALGLVGLQGNWLGVDKNTWVMSAATLVLGIVSSQVISHYYFKKGTQKVYYWCLDRTLLSARKNIKITYRGTEVPRVNISQFTLRNFGPNPLARGHFQDPLEVRLHSPEQDTTVVDYEVLQGNNSVIVVPSTRNTFYVFPEFLDVGQRLTLRVWHTGEKATTRLRLETANIQNVPGGPKERANRGRINPIFSLFVLFLIAHFTAILLAARLTKILDGYPIILVPLVLVILIPLPVILYKSIFSVPKGRLYLFLKERSRVAEDLDEVDISDESVYSTVELTEAESTEMLNAIKRMQRKDSQLGEPSQ